MNTKAFLPALLLGFLPLTAPPAHAASGLWSDVAASQIATRGQRFVTPERGRTLTLDYAAMQQLLKDAPLESEIAAVNSPFELELPLPEGGFGRFSVVESPIRSPSWRIAIRRSKPIWARASTTPPQPCALISPSWVFGRS